MKIIDLIALEAARKERKLLAIELANAALRRKMYVRGKSNSPDVHKMNMYQLYTSGKPTGELMEMTHVEATTRNQILYQDFVTKVREAIEAGGRYEGLLSRWHLYKHHTETEPEPAEAKAAKARALEVLESARRKSSKRKLR